MLHVLHETSQTTESLRGYWRNPKQEPTVGAQELSISWSHIPTVAILSYTSNIPQTDILTHVGLCLKTVAEWVLSISEACVMSALALLLADERMKYSYSRPLRGQGS